MILIANDKVTVEEHYLVETLNDQYIKKAENSSGEKPRNYVSHTNLLNYNVVSNKRVQCYSSQPGLIKIRENFGNSQNIRQFQFNIVTASVTQKLLKNKNDKKAEETDKVRHKLSATLLPQPLADAVNNSTSKGVCPDNSKVGSVPLVDK